MNDRQQIAAALRGMVRAALLAAVTVVAVACGGGSGIEGKYTGAGEGSLLESLTLGSDGEASIVYPLGFGTSGPARYEVEGNTVSVTIPRGDRVDFQLDDDGCLNHFFLGKLCRTGSATSGGSSSSVAAATGGGGTERYEATLGEGLVSLELLGGGSARMTMTPFGGGGGDMPQRMSFDVSYETRGGNIMIEMPGEGPTELVRSGRDLLMTVDGETARFIRQ